MPTPLDTIEAEALKLFPEERVCLADHLFTSVSGEQEVEDAWAVKVERRIAEVEAGRTPLVPVRDAILRARQTLA